VAWWFEEQTQTLHSLVLERQSDPDDDPVALAVHPRSVSGSEENAVTAVLRAVRHANA